MKKFSFVWGFALFCIASSWAQDPIQGQITQTTTNWTTTLQNLNTSQITSGILYDKVAPFSNLLGFNRPDHNRSDNNHFLQALSELHRASSPTKFISADALKATIASTTPANTTDVGVLCSSFHLLNYNENRPSDGGLTYSNGVLYPIAGKPSFLSKTVLVASPLKEIVSGSSAVFKFSNNLIFKNTTSPLKELTVNFGNGGSAVTVVNNGSLVVQNQTVNYTTKGLKLLTFTATLYNNQTFTTYGTVYFDYRPTNASVAPNNLPCYENLKDKGIHTSTIEYKGHEETSPLYGKIEYTIFYHDNNGNTLRNLVKPIIIIDGFDPGDKRKVQDCDCENDPTCLKQNGTIHLNLLNNSTFPPIYNISYTFNPDKHRSMEEMMKYEDLHPITGEPTYPNLISVLRGKGYDVIVINHPTYTTTNFAGQEVTIDGGADYIQRNAMNLASFIQYIKGVLSANGSNEKLSIVGPSMGGQISRYALAYMDKKFAETNNPIWQHNTRLWISVDSPHLGANVPLGTQAAVYYFGYLLGDEETKKKYNDELNSTAGRQQLITQFTNFENSSSKNSLFTNYYNDISTNGLPGSGGYPISTSTFRKISLVNGSLDGTKTNMGSNIAFEGKKYLDVRGYIDLSWWFFKWSITVFRDKNHFLPATGQSARIHEGYKMFDTSFSFDVYNPSIYGSFDVIPGGMFNSQKDVKDGIAESLSDNGARHEIREFYELHSFIPSFSALGHLQPNQNWGNPLNYNLKCPSNNLTPFDSYYGISSNTIHTSFTKESVAWLLKELDGIPQVPNFPVFSSSLVGPETLCINSNATFSFESICKIPSDATWEVSPNLQILSNTNIGITVKGLYSGEATITAIFQNEMRVTKKIWVGTPVLSYPEECFSFEISSNDCWTMCQNTQFQTDANIVKAVAKGLPLNTTQSDWQWQKLTNNFNWSAIGSSATIAPYQIGNISFRVRAKNSCGWSDWLIYQIAVNKCPSGGNFQFRLAEQSTTYTVFPNPSNDIVNIELRDEKNQPERDAKISGELFDMLGLSKTKVEIIDNKAILSVRGLNKGIYVLKIYINDQVESHQIAVE